MPITPDTKDWTWVAEQPCHECGFDPGALAPDDIAPTLRRTSDRWVALLRSGRADLATRPDDSTWAPVEYGAHVRDVIRVYDERLRLMVETDDPLYENWDQDATAVEDRYLEQVPGDIADAIAVEGPVLADRFESVTDWQRPGRRSDGARFTTETFGRYFLHDLLHHLHDVGA
jgi:hypothetical protein